MHREDRDRDLWRCPRRHRRSEDMSESTTLPAELLDWASEQQPHRRAAVGLLVEHEHWLHRRDFIDSDAIYRYPDGAYVNFTRARELFDGGAFPASSSERAVLDLAIALGEDRYRIA